MGKIPTRADKLRAINSGFNRKWVHEQMFGLLKDKYLAWDVVQRLYRVFENVEFQQKIKLVSYVMTPEGWPDLGLSENFEVFFSKKMKREGQTVVLLGAISIDERIFEVAGGKERDIADFIVRTGMKALMKRVQDLGPDWYSDIHDHEWRPSR